MRGHHVVLCAGDTSRGISVRGRPARIQQNASSQIDSITKDPEETPSHQNP